jgi:hypothetical protein
VTTDEDRGEEIVIDDSDDDIEIVAVRDSSTNSYEILKWWEHLLQ